MPMDLESDAEAEGEGEGNGEDAEAEQALIEAETEKIRIMEELWQARHSGRKTEQNYKLLLLINKQEGVKLPPEPPGHCSKELQVTNPSKFSKGHVTRHVASSCQERLTLLSAKIRAKFSES